jgi:PAS domain S-box-containing protein
VTDRGRRSSDRQALLDAVERSTLVGLAAVDETGTQTYVNAAFCALVGFTEDELLGQKPPFRYWPPEEMAVIDRAFELTVRGEAPRDGFELTFRRKNDERFFVQLLIAPMIDSAGQRVGFVASLYDITERKQKEQAQARLAREQAARAEAEAARVRLESILEHLPVGVMIAAAPSGATTYSNLQAQRIFGGPVTATETAHDYETTFKVWDKAGRPLKSEEFPLVRGLLGEMVERQDVVFERADGRRAVVRASAAPIRDADGSVISAVTAYYDVTDADRLERALADSERRFRTLAESTSVIVWTSDPDGNIVVDSPTWRRFTGQTVEQWTGGAGFDPLHPEDREPVREAWARAVRNRRPFEAEYRLRRHDGIYVPMAVTAAPVLNDDGTIREWVGTNVDITRDRQLEEERARLLASEQSARRDAEHARQRMVLLDRVTAGLLADLQTGAVDRFGRAVVPTLADWCSIYVAEPDGSIAIAAMANVDEDRVRLAREHLERYPMRSDLPWGIAAVVASGKAELIVDVSDEMLGQAATQPEHLQLLLAAGIKSHIAVPLKVGDRVVGVMSLTMTASDRRFDRDDLAFAEELGVRAALALEHVRLFEAAKTARASAEAANRAKDEFLAMLGHELRNPLAPIVTAVQLMRLRGNDAILRELSIVDRQVGHMVRLVDDLLDVSRITRGKIELRTERVEIADVVAKAIEMSSPLLEQRGHHLSVLAPRIGLTVQADESRLAQVFANLLTNAAKYTDRGGRVAITAAREGSEVVVRVRDNGDGISAELLPHIFELFAQAPQTIERTRGGLGIGLTLVRSLVALHGGTVDAHSAGSGTGSEFVVRLPAAEQRATAAALPAETPFKRAATRSGRVLIVDDNEDAALLMAEALRTMGFETAVAHDGPAALKLSSVFAPQVAILDIGLPVMDGYQLAAALREQLGDVRLIAATGYGQDADRRRSRQAGFQHHLVKPIDLAQLEFVLDELLGGEST